MSDERRQFADQRYLFFVTFPVYRHRRPLDADHPKRIVLAVLNHLLDSLSAKCVGFVLMPDHVHALLWLQQPTELKRMLHGWKRMSSFRIRRWYAEHAPRYFAGFGPGERFWQPKPYTFHVYTQKKLREKLNYIHLSPVRADLVTRAEDWPWGSARWYARQQSVGVPITWIEGG